MRSIRILPVIVVLIPTVMLTAAPIFSEENDTSLVQGAIANSSFEWKSHVNYRVHLFYQPDSFAEKHRAVLLRSAANAIEEALQFLGEPEYTRVLNVFYVETRGEMEQLIGQPVSGYADWTGSGIFLVCNPEWRSFDTHEITHVLSMSLWDYPAPSSQWMIEGISIATDGWCREYSIDELAYDLLNRDELPGLETFFTNYQSFGEVRAGVYAASIIGYFQEIHGPEVVKKLWIGGSDELTKLLGFNAEQIETSWRSYLESKIQSEVEIDWETIDELGCG